MKSYYILSQKYGEEPKKKKLFPSNENDAFVLAREEFMKIPHHQIRLYKTFQFVEVDEDKNGWLGVLYQLEYIFKKDKVYYYPTPDYEEDFFGSSEPICVDAIEMLRLFAEWIDYWDDESETSIRDYLSGMTIATWSQIEEYGVYDS